MLVILLLVSVSKKASVSRKKTQPASSYVFKPVAKFSWLHEVMKVLGVNSAGGWRGHYSNGISKRLNMQSTTVSAL